MLNVVAANRRVSEMTAQIVRLDEHRPRIKARSTALTVRPPQPEEKSSAIMTPAHVFAVGIFLGIAVTLAWQACFLPRG